MDPLISPYGPPPDPSEFDPCDVCWANLFDGGEHEPGCPQMVPAEDVLDPAATA